MNYNYFDKIDTEEKAYWLGFIFADGNISRSEYIKKDGKLKKGVYRIEISLKSDDIHHLEKLKKAINYEKNIKISKTSFRSERCRLFFNNKHMWNILNSYGCTPNKSLNLKFPDIKIFEDNNLIIHFIRGYIDGDGCISYNNINKTRMSIKILGTYDFLYNLQKNLPLEKDNKINQIENIFELSYNDRRGLYVCSKLYKNANIYLDQKYNRYLEYCRLYEESYRL